MPEHNQQSLIHVLLFWTTMLSIIQIVFITFFFTNGHHYMSQNTSAVAAESIMQPPRVNNAPSWPPKPELGRMLRFYLNDIDKTTWEPRNKENKEIISQDKEALVVMKDGHYYINLQVTSLQNVNKTITVSLIYHDKVILQGWINSGTSSTGSLGKVHSMTAGNKLQFSIEPNTADTKLDINVEEAATHLDFIYIKNDS